MSIINTPMYNKHLGSLAAHSYPRINSDQRPIAASKLHSDLPQNLIEGRGYPILYMRFTPAEGCGVDNHANTQFRSTLTQPRNFHCQAKLPRCPGDPHTADGKSEIIANFQAKLLIRKRGRHFAAEQLLVIMTRNCHTRPGS